MHVGPLTFPRSNQTAFDSVISSFFLLIWPLSGVFLLAATSGMSDADFTVISLEIFARRLGKLVTVIFVLKGGENGGRFFSGEIGGRLVGKLVSV